MASHLICTQKNGVKTVILNRPSRKNAFNLDMYKSLTKLLNEDAQNDSIVVTIITGQKDFFSSGNDLKDALERAEQDVRPVENMINAFINYPKILIAVVNGLAVGIGTTLLGLCDVVYASTNATFSTPFVRLGLAAEGCSTYNFPRTLGRSLASEMLLLGRKLTAQEAYQFGFVSRLIKPNEIDDVIREIQNSYGDLPVNTVKTNKKLISSQWQNLLCECNAREMKAVAESSQSEECSNAVMKFIQRKSHL